MKLNPTQVRTNVTTTKPSPRPGFELATESEADAVRGKGGGRRHFGLRKPPLSYLLDPTFFLLFFFFYL